MKKNKIYQGFLLCLTGLFLVASCTKNDTVAIVPIGTEYYVEDILTVVPDSAFRADFGSYATGPIPPKIEGGYLVSPRQRVKSNLGDEWPLQVVDPNVFLRFTSQHNGIAVMEMGEDTENTIDTVFVMGNGNAFTVYFIENKVVIDFEYQGETYTLRTRRGVVMTGKVTADGLADLRYATIVMAADSEPAGVPMQEVGSYFIYKDGNGLAETLDW